MKTACLVSLLLAISIAFAAGRVCWHCENARSNTECLAIGYSEECLTNEIYCQNEVRSIGGRFAEVTKRCKQDMSCDNNQFQNTSGSQPFQCEDGYPHRVCRCCCGYDNCNKYTIDCPTGDGTCPQPDAPANGFTRCYTSPQRIGDKCSYRCNLGYKLDGDDTTTCVETMDGPAWSTSPPLCISINQCDEVETPEHGSKSCTDGIRVGSVCSFVCDEGYIIYGPESINCNVFGFWNKDPPECLVGKCLKPKPDDDNRVQISCSDKHNLYSTCKYGCKSGWTLETLYDSITCGLPIVNGRGSWDNPAPTCKRDSCTDPDNSADKIIECTENYLVGSICDVRCAEPGHYLDLRGTVINKKTFQIKCTPSGWDKLLPDCKPVTCRPKTTDPARGSHSCTLGNTYTSVCSFVCDEDYHITGKSSIQCLADKNYDQYGRWSARQPTCDPDGCNEPDGIEDKVIVCTKDFLVGSTCDVSCKEEGHYLESNGVVINKQTFKIRCNKDGRWDRKVPDCVPVTCRPKTTNPTDGTHSCTLGNTYTSVCSFFCNSGYTLRGEPSIQCLADNNYDQYGRWSDRQPTCQLDKCDPPDVGPDIVVTCPDGHEVGAKCSFRCKDGTYELEGDSEAECKQGADGIPKWDWTVKPTCVPMYCDGWDPVNKGVITCVPPPTQLPSDGDRWRIGTDCTLQCERPNYNVKAFPTSRCVGKNNWNIKSLCCVRCVVNPSLDMVVLLDSSYATADLWADYEDFTKNYPTELLGNNYNINYYVIPYATNTDLANEKFYPEMRENKLKGLDKLSLPFEGTGDSNAGEALKYVNDEIFKVMPKYRVPMVVLVTTRRPTDWNVALEESKKLEARGIHIRIVPLVEKKNADAGKNYESFQDLTSDDKYIIEMDDEEDFYTFATDGVAVVTKMKCNDKTQELQPCV